jgi:hypothetical protein
MLAVRWRIFEKVMLQAVPANMYAETVFNCHDS